MNKFYDKLFLAIAVLALLAGVGFYFVSSGGGENNSGLLASAPSGDAYQPVLVSSTDVQPSSWPEAQEQSTGWLYEVFTPPQIFIDENGEFTIIPIDNTPPPPFGLYLAEMERVPYRIQLEGYIEEKPGDASKTLLLMYDEERKRSVRGRIGRKITASDFEVLDFTVERVRLSESDIRKVAQATILDTRSGEQVVLTHGERLYNDAVTVRLKSEEDPSIDLEFDEAGVSFETPLGDYVLEQINLEESTVTVRKIPQEDSEPEIKVLTLEVPSNETSAPETQTIEDDESATAVPSGSFF